MRKISTKKIKNMLTQKKMNYIRKTIKIIILVKIF